MTRKLIGAGIGVVLVSFAAVGAFASQGGTGARAQAGPVATDTPAAATGAPTTQGVAEAGCNDQKEDATTGPEAADTEANDPTPAPGVVDPCNVEQQGQNGDGAADAGSQADEQKQDGPADANDTTDGPDGAEAPAASGTAVP